MVSSVSSSRIQRRYWMLRILRAGQSVHVWVAGATDRELLRLECAEKLLAKPIGSNNTQVKHLQLRKYCQRVDEVLVVTLCVEMQYARLQRSDVAGRRSHSKRRLAAYSLLACSTLHSRR